MWIERPIGIDLGTTNSCAAMLDLDGQRLMLAEDAHGRSIVPSVVGFDPITGQRIAGFPAWNRRGMSPEPVQSVKRKMGLDQTVSIGSEQLTPAEVSAEILKAMRAQMSHYLKRFGREQDRLKAAVITVPAYFDAPQIEATRRAGELAGFEVLGLLQEPTAACMYVVWQRDLGDGNFLVYDLGGGTFDVSVIRALHGEYQVLSIHGDNYLGGDDFDRRLAERFRQTLCERGYALDLKPDDAEDQVRFLLLTRVAREVKEALSGSPVQYVARRDLFRDQKGQLVTLELEYSRTAWNALMKDLLESSIRCCQEALDRAKETAGVTLADIDHVILVGGSTRSPIVQEMVQAAFCGPGKSKAAAPLIEAPDSCVALGAAIYAANLGGVRFAIDDPAISVHITSPLYGRREQTRLSGQLSGTAASAAHSVALQDAHGVVLSEEDLSDDSRFRFSSIPLPEQGLHRFTLNALAEDGQSIATFPLSLYRSADTKQTGSALSNPTVVAKDIFLEISRMGKLERKVLVARGQTLPVTVTQQLLTGDQSGAVLLTLLQNRYPISTIHIEVPKELPAGSPVTLEVKVDEKLTMTASGEVAGQQFWAQIEPPPPRQLKHWAEVEQKIDAAEQLSKKLWGYDALYFQRHAPFLISSIREAARTDLDKLQVLVVRLEQLIEQFQGSSEDLSPGFERFSALLDGIRRVVFKGDAIMGMDFAAWEARLTKIQLDGVDAFSSRDQGRWSRAYAQAQALYETVSQDEARFERANDPNYIKSLIATLEFTANALREKIDGYVLPKHPDVRRLQADALSAIDADFNLQVLEPLTKALAFAAIPTPSPTDISDARAKLDIINQHLKHLERRIEQVPSIGVVSAPL